MWLNGSGTDPSTVLVKVKRAVPQLPGRGGSMLFCDGVNDFAFAEGFSVSAKQYGSRYGVGAMTVEMWVFAMSYGEDGEHRG